MLKCHQLTFCKNKKEQYSMSMKAVSVPVFKDQSLLKLKFFVLKMQTY